jgi:flagellin-like protein
MADRGVSPVIGVILVVAVVVILVATVSIFVFGFTGVITEPAPNVADTTGEFVIDQDDAEDNQIVRIKHIAGDSVDVENIEIIVRASGPDVDTEARLVDLPGDGFFTRSLADSNIDGNDDLIDQGFESARIIVVDDPNTWTAGTTIEFRINTGNADFREGESPEADELEVIIVHTPSNAIISEQTFTP